MRKHQKPTANEVRELRLMNGMTQKNLADLLAISEKSVQAYEQGRRNMPASTWLLMYSVVPTVERNDPDDWCSFEGDEIGEKQSL